ncbi:MAG: TatD family hydrolase [bacterium]
MLIDTHAHVNFVNAYKDDAEAVIRRALRNDVNIILVSTCRKTSKRALELANKYESGVYVAIGLHPLNLEDHEEKLNGYTENVLAEEFNFDVYQQLSKFDKVVAVGEIGLDYFQPNPDHDFNVIKKKQQESFKKQIEFAVKTDLPVIIHCRQAHDDMLKILTEHKGKFKDSLPKDQPWGVMHCFSGDENLAWQYFNIGMIISFTGIVTFSQQWDDLIRKMPDDKIMVETDCPFMAPEPYRGKRNEPVLVKYVAQRIAEIKNYSLGKVEEMTTENAKKLFKI